MKKIDTLVEDLESVIYGQGGWNGTIGSMLGNNIAMSANKRFSKPQEPRGYLSLSSIGTPCKRKLWYKVNKPGFGEPLSANLLLRFFYRDMIEELILSMVIASGHSMEGSQDRLNVHGIRGHRDCVIDGMTVDVKSCSPYAFKKFKEGTLRENDAFGYISQLSSYVYAGKDDPLVTDKTHGAFLAIDKVSGEICLDVHDFTEDLETKEEEMLAAKELVAGDIPTDRVQPVPASKASPNTKLDKSCQFCEYKKVCWPNLRMFKYSYGIEYLVHVEKEPKVQEVFDDTSS
jgi:CRISPR/Cas system-associated exonuclease Cas4 (RecB family)